MPDLPQIDDDLVVARHEAAHAVIWMLHGYDVLSATVAMTSEENAKGTHGRTIEGDYTGVESADGKTRAVAYVIGLLAAGDYEEKVYGKPSKGLVSDFQLINSYLSLHTPRQNVRLLNECYDRLACLFGARDVCAAVEELAQVLMQRGAKVEGSEIRAIVTKHCAPRMAAGGLTGSV